MRWMRLIAAAAVTAAMAWSGGASVPVSCIDGGANPPGGTAWAWICIAEGYDQPPPYPGRYSQPVQVQTYAAGGSLDSTTVVQAGQYRWRATSGPERWRDTHIWLGRSGSAGSMYAASVVETRQVDGADGNGSYRATWVHANTSASGSLGSWWLAADAGQARWQSSSCNQSGGAVVYANGPWANVPVGEHACPAEAPVAPDIP